MACPNCMNAGGLCESCEETFMSDKPREWVLTDGLISWSHGKVRVIEYSAYESAIKERDRARAELREFEDMDMVKAMRALHAKSSKLVEEIKCLRSVLSEWDCDKSCYTQWIRANELAASHTKSGDET